MSLSQPVSPGVFKTARLLLSLFLAAALVFFVVRTLHWHWMFDESIMHYVNFLIDHGKVPYRDIIDLNLPGAYFLDGWAIHIFGSGDFGWRFYDYSLLAILIASMIVIAAPIDWFAGLFAGTLFVFVHAVDGPQMAAERDEIMTVLVLAGYAFLFTSLRRRNPLLLLPFGFLLGLAGTLKPPAAPLGFVLLAMAAYTLRRRSQPLTAYLVYGLTGMLAAGLLTLRFLLATHSLSAFVEIMHRMVPFYAPLGNVSYRYLLRFFFSIRLFVLFLIALIVTIFDTNWRSWERVALILGVLFGAASYFVQHKGTAYHRYPFYAFLLLWIAIEYVKAIRRPGWVRLPACAGILVGTLVIVPVYARTLYPLGDTTALPTALMADLTRLGGPRLQNQVECLDMVSGCVDALYRLGLVEPQPFMGDYMLFPPNGGPPFPYYGELFWQQIHRDPPKVFVITTEMLTGGGRYGRFDNLRQWPAFEAFLNQYYRLDIARQFGPGDYLTAYRIYLLKSGTTPSLQP